MCYFFVYLLEKVEKEILNGINKIKRKKSFIG